MIQDYKEAMHWLAVIELAEKGDKEEQETLRIVNKIRAEAGEPTIQEEINKLVEAGRKEAEKQKRIQQLLAVKQQKAMDRNEEVQLRIAEWEEKNNKKIQNLSRNEWISAMAEIMAMTEEEAEEYLNYLLQQRDNG